MIKEVIICQPSKVGSSTVVETLLNHYSIPKDKGISCPGDNYKYPIDGDVRICHTHDVKDLPEKLRDSIADPRCVIYYITLTRDHMARNISGFFEPKTYLHEQKPLTEVPGLIDEFINYYPQYRGIHWFETNFKDTGFYNIVYGQEFNKSKGYQIYENGKNKMLFIKTEFLSAKLEIALSEFLGELLPIQVINANIGSKKKYSALYHEFKSKIKVPKDMLDAMYQNKHTKHFYTRKEISEFYRKWGDNITMYL